MSLPPRALAVLAALTASVGPLWGCGDEPERTRVTDRTLELEMRDFRFDPQAVETSRGRLQVEAVNRGRLPHALRITRGGREHLRIGSLLPGERETATVSLEPGTYRLVCPIGNHEELGMYGSLVVR